MKVAIVGAGFTGLSAGLKLSERKVKVTIFEKEKTLGGLASTFRLPSWQWALEKHYHHWFTNDSYALDLIEKLGLKNRLIFPKTVTSIYYQSKIYPFNSPFDVLTFTPLTIFQRLRTGLVTLYLKLLPEIKAVSLERFTAWQWLEKYYGKEVFSILWKPLLSGKFGPFAKDVNMAWFWARIKKRTPKLGYLQGGYHLLLEAMAGQIKKDGGTIKFSTPFDPKISNQFDKIIATTPGAVLLHIFPNLITTQYGFRLKSIPHLHALNLLIISKEKILPDTYWLNINEANYPFIAVVQHTNLVDKRHYAGNHITWVANYLPPDHKYLQMTKEQLLKTYLPYLKKINPRFSFKSSVLGSELFLGPFAQPVFPINYSKIKPDFTTPIPNVFLANMDMVYPWDRGTNYAIELGEKVANLLLQRK